MSINDGGPAFPRPYSKNPKHHASIEPDRAQEGMRLRDYFANSAKEKHFEKLARRVDRVKDSEYLDAARMAYKEADAMLKARALPVGEGAET